MDKELLKILALLQGIADGDWLDDPKGCQEAAHKAVNEFMQSIKDPNGPKYVIKRPDHQ